MTDESPAPPPTVPNDVVDVLDELDPDALRQFARYAEAVADRREREAESDPERHDDPDDVPEDRPDDVPPKATVTVKEINDNRYYYWQWREGDQIKSAYKGPVDPND